MASVYSPASLGIKAPSGGFQQGGWYEGRQYWGGTLSDPGVIHPSSNQQGAGQAVSREVNAQSAAKQGVSSDQLEKYLQQQRDKQAAKNVQPTANYAAPTTWQDPGDVSTGAGVGYSAPEVINLPDLYKSATQEAGIADIEKRLLDKREAYNTALSKINDNPFLSEANRTGRERKLTTDYENSIQNDQNEMAMKKADIEMQLNLATQQFNIESQAAQQALNQFNVLLQSGALAGASGNDIAGITRATGISSSMIKSAIATQQKRDRQTSVQTIDDGTNVYAVVLDTQTGEVVNKQVIGSSKPSAGRAPSESEQKSYYMNALRQDASSGVPLQQIYQLYTGYLDPDTILYLYNANSSWGPAKESMSDLSRIYGVTDRTKTLSPEQQYYQNLLGQ